MKNNRLIICCLLITIILSACGNPGNDGNMPDGNQPVNVLPEEDDPPEEDPLGDTVRGEIYITEKHLAILESYPVQITVNIIGDLPTPCHKFKAEVNPPNDKNEIHLEVYTTVNTDEICVQALEPFNEFIPIPMSGKPDGIYSVWVNGEKIGEFRYPG